MLYYLLSLLTGIVVSVMVAINGGLTEQYGVYSATVFIHISGLALITVFVLAKKERPFSQRHAWFLYLGGAIGVLTTVFNNAAFGRISVSAILALGLFGQTISGLIVDQYGLFKMPKHPFTRQKLIGVLLILGGIVSMVDNFEIIAVVVSFIAGVNIIVSRTLNAKLADSTSVGTSAFYNYFVGLIVSIPVFFILGRSELEVTKFVISQGWYIYFGGALGLCVILLSNITVMKISAFYLTLLSFVGQVFSGVLIDAIISKEFSFRIFAGGVLVAAGLCLNLLLDTKG